MVEAFLFLDLLDMTAFGRKQKDVDSVDLLCHIGISSLIELNIVFMRVNTQIAHMKATASGQIKWMDYNIQVSIKMGSVTAKANT